ncbi:nucleoside-diphosphate-sugar epimerase [Thermoplasmatales archaeon SCGC AB-539-N05]|nr:nucleoside-diphosphate-sugar epimerase [Thermoplasmatales archaeon SCGC AB-539-N05]
MKVVVTGAAGFIGSNLTKRLEKDPDTELVLVDDFSRGKQGYLDYLGVKTRCYKSDLRDYETASNLIKNADVVYHTACRIGGVQFLHGSSAKELLALQENLVIDRNVFKVCVEHKIKKIIYTSSISVYNTNMQYKTNAVFREEDLIEQPIDPEGGYGWAKYVAEKELKMMSECGMKVGVARIFKSYGSCDDYSEESGQVVCSLCRKAINYPKEEFIVWGDGSVSRCLVYIDDLIDALIQLEKQITNKSLTVNLGGNRPIPIKELAERIVNISDKNIKIKYDTTKPVGPLSRIPDLSRAKKTLNWEPTTNLDEGLRRTYQWMEETLKG